MSHRNTRRWLVAAFVLSPMFASASGGLSPPGPVACPAQSPLNFAALATAGVSVDPQDGITIPGAASPPQAADAQLQARKQEQASFARILSERSAVTVPVARRLSLLPQRRSQIEGDPAPDVAVPQVGAAIEVGRTVEFARVDPARLASGGTPASDGIIGRTDQGVLIWETALSSPEAKALRLEFADLELADGVELYVYNEDGQVWGPYVGRGPDGNGQLWSPSSFGDTVRVHLRARDSGALAASRFTLARVMHLGSRVGPLQDRIRQQYAVGPSPDDANFCGVAVPDCTQDAVCWIDQNAGLTGPSDAIAHLQFVTDSGTFICTGAYLAQTGNVQQPYFMTANHCFSTQAVASSLEAFFKYRTGSCNGTCPNLDGVPRVNGATLIATGARPTAADYTFLRLPGFPAGGANLLGWTTSSVPEGATIIHMGHPNGSPLAFSYRRARLNSASIPHGQDLPEPTFLYSGLASAQSDWAGAFFGGSSGGPALLMRDGGAVSFVGQLYGYSYPSGETPNFCNPNTNGTIDGALRSSYGVVGRYLYDRIFTSGFDG